MNLLMPILLVVSAIVLNEMVGSIKPGTTSILIKKLKR